MIFDCFTFFNELELLDLRIMVLNDLVDCFVLVEANKTHTGKPKEFIFEQNKDKFKDHLDKIIYIKVEDLPDYSKSNIWPAENFQRNCITRALREHAKDGDKVIISDVDEIPNPDTLSQHINSRNPITMSQHLFYYYVNCFQQQPWHGSIMATYGNYNTPQELRNTARSGRNIVPGGGWHYSFMGGAERIRLKVESIAESDLIINKVGSIDEIKHKMDTQKDLWSRSESFARKTIVDINKSGMSPKYINEFIKKYPHFFFGEIK